MGDEINGSLNKQQETWRMLDGVEGLHVLVHTFLSRIRVVVGDDFFKNFAWPGTREDVDAKKAFHSAWDCRYLVRAMACVCVCVCVCVDSAGLRG